MYSFFFNDPATTEIYTLSLHDALPIFSNRIQAGPEQISCCPGSEKREIMLACAASETGVRLSKRRKRSEEHTSELQSRPHLVCRLLLEKKKEITHLNAASSEHTDCSSF